MAIDKNADLRRQKVMKLIDGKIQEAKIKHGCRVAKRMEEDIIEDVSESEIMAYSTLQRYYSNWKSRKGIFAHLKHSEC